MREITISNMKNCFMENSKKFFYLADTCWSAFTNIPFEEWEEYLDYRAMQGFNVLQINILPQWDASESDIKTEPFNKNEDGTRNFMELNEEYFSRAEQMLEIAVNKGFTPALVLLWSNYVPGTWASDILDKDILPIESIEGYIKYVGEKFKKFKPIFIVSGDTDFPSERTIEYYRIALKTIKYIAPECIRTMHIRGRLMELPEEFESSEDIDFYMYQSGHNSSHMDMPYLLAENFYKKDNKKPIINSEPCYEQMGYSGNLYGRFSRFDVRKALWQSLLSGGSAGITYGAHGIWSWHKNGKGFGIGIGECFDKPFYWRDALKFEGAWDYSFAKWIFDKYNLCGIKPMENYISKSNEIRMAATEDENVILIYIPINTNVVIDLDLNNYDFETIDLSKRRFAKSSITLNEEKTTINMHSFDEDVLVIGVRE